MLTIIDLPELATFEVGDNCFNQGINTLTFCDYPKLQKIMIATNSFNLLGSLTISNLPQLNTLQIFNQNSLVNLKTLTINSTFSLYSSHLSQI